MKEKAGAFVVNWIAVMINEYGLVAKDNERVADNVEMIVDGYEMIPDDCRIAWVRMKMPQMTLECLCMGLDQKIWGWNLKNALAISENEIEESKNLFA